MDRGEMRIFHRYFLPSFGSYCRDFRRFLEIDQSETKIACGCHVSCQMRRNEQSLQRTFQGYFPYQISVHLEKRFKRRFFQKSTNQKQELPVAVIFVNGSELNEQSLQRTFEGCLLQSFNSFGDAVSEKKIFQKSINQKQELSVAAMFVNGSGQNV